MSRRFGRNQRRKMREQLELLQDGYNTCGRILDDRERKIKRQQAAYAELERVIQLTRRVLGNYFSTLPVQSTPCHHLPDDEYARFSLTPSSPDFLNDAQALNMMLRSVELAVLRGDTTFDALRQQAHIRFVSRAGEVAYAFTAGAFNHCPPEYVIETLSREMANHLADDPRFRSFTLLSDDNGWYAREARLRRRTYEPKP